MIAITIISSIIIVIIISSSSSRRRRRRRSGTAHVDEKRSLFLAAKQCEYAYLSLYTFFMQGMSGQICKCSSSYDHWRPGPSSARPR